MGQILSQGWIALVAVVVVSIAGFAVYRLQSAFGSDHNPKTSGGPADQIVPFNPKHVVLEVFGDPGATATITYMDVDSTPQRVDNAPLPWIYDESTTTPAVLVNIQAQGDGSTLGCRITIDGVVKAENSSNTATAYTFCLDKSG